MLLLEGEKANFNVEKNWKGIFVDRSLLYVENAILDIKPSSSKEKNLIQGLDCHLIKITSQKSLLNPQI